MELKDEVSAVFAKARTEIKTRNVQAPNARKILVIGLLNEYGLGSKVRACDDEEFLHWVDLRFEEVWRGLPEGSFGVAR